MTKKFKTFEQLHHHNEADDMKVVGKKRKSRFFDENNKRNMNANLKSHFPDRIWNKVNEKKKGRKV